MIFAFILSATLIKDFEKKEIKELKSYKRKEKDLET